MILPSNSSCTGFSLGAGFAVFNGNQLFYCTQGQQQISIVATTVPMAQPIDNLVPHVGYFCCEQLLAEFVGFHNFPHCVFAQSHLM